MAMIAAKCTNCGANIQVDETKEAGICEACGTAFITEKAINNYNTYITNNNNFSGANINVVGGDVANLLELAVNALEVANEKDALKYCEKALEIDVKSAEAWFLKMKAEGVRCRRLGNTIEEARSIESISVAGNNAIKYSDDATKEQRIKDVHSYYLEAAKDLMTGMKVNVEYDNISVLKALAQTNGGAALAQDQMFILGLTTKELFALKLIEDISESEFDENPHFQNALIELINEYVEFRNRYKNRTLIYSGGPNAEAVASMKSKYDNMLSKVPEDRRGEVKTWTLVGCANTSSSSSGSSSDGCYVATCVYGSYDCPQVWTLRRFRDNTLAETMLGRAFIRTYYAISPTLVRWFGDTSWFKKMWKGTLDRMVSKLQSNGVENTPYQDRNWR